jgi:plastocyanin
METRHLLAVVPLVLGIACGASPGPGPAAGAAPCVTGNEAHEALPTPGPADTIKGGRIVGTVTTTPWHGIKNGAVVYIEDAPKQPGVGLMAAVDNHDMAFVPFITVLTAGGTVTFGNTDPLIHNVFSPDGEKWDLGSLPQNGAAAKKFDAPGAYTLLCNIHQDMLGYVVVSPSSYFAKTTSDGTFAITGVPAGTYKVTAWAPRLTSSTQSITVGPSGDVVANFKLAH